MRKDKRMEIKPHYETYAKIRVVGIGGAGGAAVDRMIASKMKGVEFIAINTDAQALHFNKADKKIHIGKSLTKGLGTGMNPDLGRQAIEEDQEEVHEVLRGSDMIFLTYGLGGGTGTGAGPIVANIAKDVGALFVGVVTKPFSFEGVQRMEIADKGYGEIKDKIDTLITIPNDKILQIIDKDTSLLQAFSKVDDILRQGVQGISDLVVVPGIINVDFADVKAIMQGAGSALMAIGRASGENRAVEAAKAAISSPLLELSIDGAKGVLFNVYGGNDLGMHEIDEAAKIITESVDKNAKIIFGAAKDERMKDEIKITVIATGFENRAKEEVKEEEKKEVRTFGMPFKKQEEEEKKKEEKELEIPAFIRRKMK